MLALVSLIALSARGQSNYTGAYYFNGFAGNSYGANGSGSQAIFNFPCATAVAGAGNVIETHEHGGRFQRVVRLRDRSSRVVE
jgi:hypothetical protein